MKIKVSDLKPNPFRNISKYPIDKDKVKALADSIESTGFWDNILVREEDGEYQIAYGHHRLAAIKKAGLTTVDIPVKELNDATMLKIMANENMEDWSASTSVTIETVRAAKVFLDETLRNCLTAKEFESVTGNRLSNQVFQQAKTKSAGAETIHQFLGGNWKEWRIKSALEVINKTAEISEEAVTMFKSQDTAARFMTAVKNANRLIEASGGTRITPAKQVTLASKLTNDGESNVDVRTIHDAVDKIVFSNRPKAKAEKEKANIQALVSKFCIAQMQAITFADDILKVGDADITKRDRALIANACTKAQKMINKFLNYNK